jgi:hypothetical protein
MATITIPAAVQQYFPQQLEPSQLWVRYNPEADALTIYFTGQPVPSVWEDVDAYANIGFAQEDETTITGVMIEHFSKWLLMPGHADQALQPA